MSTIHFILNFISTKILRKVNFYLFSKFSLQKVQQGTLKKSFAEYLAHCTNFVEKAIPLCWLMKNIEEQIILDFSVNHGDPMNELKYQCYSESGKEIDYIVWPVLLLKGGVLQKGVVQTSQYAL